MCLLFANCAGMRITHCFLPRQMWEQEGREEKEGTKEKESEAKKKHSR